MLVHIHIVGWCTVHTTSNSPHPVPRTRTDTTGHDNSFKLLCASVNMNFLSSKRRVNSGKGVTAGESELSPTEAEIFLKTERPLLMGLIGLRSGTNDWWKWSSMDMFTVFWILPATRMGTDGSRHIPKGNSWQLTLHHLKRRNVEFLISHVQCCW